MKKFTNKIRSRFNVIIGFIIASLGIGLTGCERNYVLMYGVPYNDVDTLAHPMYGVPNPNLINVSETSDDNSEQQSNNQQ